MKPARRARGALLLAAALLPAACSGSDGDPDPGPPCTDCPTADLTGTWAVVVSITEAGADCGAEAVGLTVSGDLTFVHDTETTFTVEDEEETGNATGSGVVLGNTAQFVIDQDLGPDRTQTWDLVITPNNDFFLAEVAIEGPDCIASATASGTKTSGLVLPPPTQPSLVLDADRGEPLGVVGGDGSARAFTPRAAPAGPGLLSELRRALD